MDERELILQYFLSRNPNTERVGCPGEDILRLVAQGRLEVESPWYSHLADCAACTAQAEGIRVGIVRKRRMVLLATAAACVVASVGLGFYALHVPDLPVPAVRVPPRAAPPPKPTVADTRPASQTKKGGPTPLVTMLDLGAFAPVRGTGSSPAPPRTLALTAADQLLRLLLPNASEAGEYRVALLQPPDGRELRAAKDRAAIQTDGRTVLKVWFQAASVEPGEYELLVQRGQEEPRVYPVLITPKER